VPKLDLGKELETSMGRELSGGITANVAEESEGVAILGACSEFSRWVGGGWGGGKANLDRGKDSGGRVVYLYKAG